ncbi:MAG: class I SAM-dependent methyltransferase, partial [Eubacteriales bacterium]|nr:class I SAM-dependent methyltransferase [Eubacteriales bacterium]
MSEQANQTIEKIGGVTLDFSRYPGQDYYCDGEVEEELLALVREHAPREFPALIEQRGDWESLYHLSPERGNIVRWLPFTGSEKVLEIGAGPGAVTSALCGRVRRVDCVELSARRSRINAYRNRERDNITIHVGNFADIEPALPADYDYILLIGVFEYARAYLGSGDAFHEELRRLLPHLAPGGRAVIAIENRLGLKYFAGCREDHTGRYFDGVEDYPDPETAVHTFSRPALERIFADCGVEQASFYYPYPDYKFPSVLFSDRRLPQASELTENIRNFDRDRLLLFDEQKAYHGIVDDGLYPVFSNSYAVVIGEPLPVSYCKFSGDRAPQYRIQTELRTGENGERQIVKRPLTPEAAAHVERLVTSCEKLKRRYEGGALAIAPCRREEVSGRRAGTVVPGLPENGAPGTEAAHGALSGVVFPFIKGRPLEELLDERLTRGDLEGFRALLRTFYERAGYRDGEPVADYDMTFANILV